jgi:hypothetical protein
MAVEDDYLDVLQNIEFGIVQFYHQTPDLIDAEVANAVEALTRIYEAEAQGKRVSSRPIRGMTKQVMVVIQAMCEIRLGRADESAADQLQLPGDLSGDQIVTPAEIAACLKRIRSSIKFWTERGGRQGYLDYIQQFMK